MGICLGYQLLFTESEEYGHTEGLNIFRGTVKKFASGGVNSVKVPQIGWNRIQAYCSQKWAESMLSNIDEGEFMYFVHSYFVDTQDQNIMLTETEYAGQKYCSSIQYKNLFASQFHPEKSGVVGLKVYEKFSKRILKIRTGNA